MNTTVQTALTDTHGDTRWTLTKLAKAANKDNYEALSALDGQTGRFGVVFVAGSGMTAGYGDLLTQALIACNYKFQLKR